MNKKTNEIQTEAPDILEIDVVSYAASTAQGTAQAIATLMGPEGAPGFEPRLWASCGEILPYKDDDTGEAAVIDLAEYVLARPAEVGGEQLFRKAAELGIHDRNGADYATAPIWLGQAYCMFASVVHRFGNVIRDLQRAAERAAEQASRSKPDPRPIDQTIFETQADMGDRDLVLVEAMQRPIMVAAEAEDARAGEPAGTLGDSGTADEPAVMSVGESPMQHSDGKVKKSRAKA